MIQQQYNKLTIEFDIKYNKLKLKLILILIQKNKTNKRKKD